MLRPSNVALWGLLWSFGERQDEAVLAKSQPVAQVAGDIKGKLTVASRMGELVCRRSPQRNATEDERAAMVGEFLLAVSAFLAHQANGIQLLELLFGDADDG